MTDIIEQLRVIYPKHPMIMQAAAEIERLRALLRHEGLAYTDGMAELAAEIEQLRAENDHFNAENEKAWKTIERLHAALQKFGDHTYECELKEPNGLCTCGYDRALEPKS